MWRKATISARSAAITAASATPSTRAWCSPRGAGAGSTRGPPHERAPYPMIGTLLDRNPRIATWLYGLTPPERGTVVLVHRRVYILPVRLGFLFCVTRLVLLIGSINYALSLGFALTFVLAGLGLVGMVHTARNLARVAVSVGRAPPVFAGEAAQFRLILEGRAPFDRPAILARHLASGAH